MSTTNYSIIKRGVTGNVVIDDTPIRRCAKHQINVIGSAGNYTIEIRTPHSGTFRAITNGTIDGATGIPAIVSARAEAFRVTPPDGAEYKVTLDGLDV